MCPLSVKKEKWIGKKICYRKIKYITSNTENFNVEKNILEKGLDFAHIQNKINQPELRKDFQEFCRRMRVVLSQ